MAEDFHVPMHVDAFEAMLFEKNLAAVLSSLDDDRLADLVGALQAELSARGVRGLEALGPVQARLEARAHRPSPMIPARERCGRGADALPWPRT